MYNKNWVAISFMRARHVPQKGCWWGGNPIATVPGGANTTGPDATHPPTIFQNLGGGVQPGVGGGSGRGSGGGGGVQPRVKGGGVLGLG